ncbi:MAG: hypothetical protein HDR88_12900 [Bacteroides sp.]|nr:hypothetical protein [Bacteroides sp.]
MNQVLRIIVAITFILRVGVPLAEGQNPTIIQSSLTDDGKILVTEKLSKGGSDIQVKKFPRKVEEDVVRYTVTPKYIYSEEDGIVPGNSNYAVSEDGSEIYSYFELHGNVISSWDLPAGIYNFIFRFESPDGMLILYKGGVEVNSNMEIEARATDAKVNYIEWQALMPDGSQPVASMEDNGSFCYPMGYTYIACQDYLLYECGFLVLKNEDEDLQRMHNVWTNAPESCSFSQVMCIGDKKGNYYIEMPAVGTGTQFISNDVNLYNCYHLHLPKDITSLTNGIVPDVNLNYAWTFCWDTYSVKSRNILNVKYDTDDIAYYYCGYEGETSYRGKLFPCPDIMTYGVDGKWFGIQPPMLKMTTTDFQFQNNHQKGLETCFFYAAYDNFGIDNTTTIRPVFNPYLALPTNCNPIFGYNTPIVVFTRPNEQFDYAYIGRYGEARTLDYLNQNFAIYLNGKKVWTDYLDLKGFYYAEDWEPGVAYEDGVWDFEIEDSNLVIDGLSTLSKCFMHFEDNDTEKFTWPTLTALQFRNMEDEITDHFTTANDGRVILTGGIWSNVDYQYFDCSTAEEFKVEYSPYQINDFSPLSVEIDPEKRFMPGYGDYYEGSLNQVIKESDTKWYDLRVTIKDVEGNYQQQTISPAFKIDNIITGITNARIDDNRLNVYVKSNSIIAPLGSHIYTYDGRMVKGDNLAQGIYMVRCGNKTAKVVIK